MPEAAEAAGSPPPRRLSGRRVLAVDDEAEIFEVLADLLAVDGYQVVVAWSGEEVLACLALGDCDLIVRLLLNFKFFGAILDYVGPNTPECRLPAKRTTPSELSRNWPAAKYAGGVLMLNWMRWLPENVSTYGGEIDSIISLIYYVTLAWFFLTLGAFMLFLVLYRRREGRRATYIRGERWREAAWIVVPVLIVLVLDLWIDFRGAPVWAKVKTQIPPTELVIQVTAKQFNWEILYPGPDGKFDTADDLKLDNELHVPVGKPVRLVLKSKDVLHSLFSPNLRLKQDIVPGRAIPAWFEATKPGKYELPCAELCGFGHSGMKGWLYVHPPEEYREWVKAQWPSS